MDTSKTLADGMLHASVGETYYLSQIAQDPKSLGGKILRMTPGAGPHRGNYRWPVVEGFGTDPRYTNPIATWTPTSIASSSGIAVLGEHVYLARLSGQGIYRVDLDGRNPFKMLTSYGRIRTVMVAPDGSPWATTANYDQAASFGGSVPQPPEVTSSCV